MDKKNRNEIVVGIDPIRTGFNPHLVADNSAFVQSLARLVLPSAFVDGHMNTDLLSAAQEIAPTEGSVQSVQYRIKQDAQWSDGSPITGTDFRYLWENLSTKPGVLHAAGYQAIKDIQIGEGGKLVTVYFSSKVANWQELFANLLPSHVFSIGNESFFTILASQVPASGGRYMVRTIDRRRGVVELARNDRFWGADPADVELLTFREVNSVPQAIEMLRNKQLSFAHLTPEETSLDSLRLAKGVQFRTVDRNARLEAIFNTKSVTNPMQRSAIASAIDVPMLARLSSQRSADIALVEEGTPRKVPDEAIAQAVAAQTRPLKIAADPVDDTARAAAVAVVDMLRAKGFAAELVQAEFATLASTKVPNGEVDVVMAWQREPKDALSASSKYSCSTAAKSPVLNLSGWCDSDAQKFFADAVAGAHDKATIADKVRGIEETNVLSVPIMRDRRIDMLGTGIVSGEPQLAKWPVVDDASVLATAYNWKDE